MTTILCVDNDPLTIRFLEAQRIEQGIDFSVALAMAAPEAIAQIAALISTGAEVPLVIASQALIDSTWLKALYGQFPQALMVLLLGSEESGQADVEQIEALIPQGQLYRCMPKPWHGVDLRLTITEALRRYRHEQQLAQMQAALAEAQGQIAGLGDRSQLEAQIRESRQQLQLTLALTGIGAWSWFPATGIYQWAGLMEMLLEIPAGQGDMYQQWRGGQCHQVYGPWAGLFTDSAG
jgi:CheY-like chemotaxis protein